MMTKDYRNTQYCPSLENIADKKKKLQNDIIEKHPRQRNIYNKVRDKKSSYNEQFVQIYNYKCAYCGVSMDVLPAQLFEVDHFIAESLFDNKNEAGKLENLALSCYQCNRNKSNFALVGEYTKKLCTDDGKIADVFCRDEDYYIRIKDEYKEDETIKKFYDKLQLVHQTRRLDYLLMNMKGLYKKLEGTTEGGRLAQAILIMQEKRNKFIA
ncbi:MAG: HNH endonuclease [Tyzzerella sp.]|nr:HNH endonuclease [Tyzzerella sp.]